MIAASILDYGLLFLPLLLNFPIGLLCIVSLAAIRGTKSFESAVSGHEDGQEEDDDADNHNNDNLNASRSIRQSARILGEALRDRRVLVLLATVPIAKAVNPIGELTWQYIPKKFGISFAVVVLYPSYPSD